MPSLPSRTRVPTVNPSLPTFAYAWVMLGSALGGGARLYVSTQVARSLGTHFPWGTLVVNLVGCLAVGALGALFAPPGRIHDLQDLRVFLVVGVLGGFTTFSAFSLEALLLAQRGEPSAALGYVAASLAGCLAASWFAYSALSAALR
jgi:CrcB protein